MKCEECKIESIENNLVLDIELYENSHDYANILYCNICNSFYIEYWVEIFDDGWKYWLKIDRNERDYITQIYLNKNPKYTIIDFIKSKNHIICKNPSDDYKIVLISDCLLEGPAW